MKHLKLFVFLGLALSISFGCGGGEPAAEESAAPETTAPPAEVFAVDPATAATVSGKVMFEGDPPKAQRLNMGADDECKAMHAEPIVSEAVVVSEDGMLANVLVWVKSGLEGKTFETSSSKVNLDQIGCIYKPHVAAVQVGQTLSVTNSDPTLHNVHPLPRKNSEWNKSQAAGAGAIEESFSKQELMIPIKCNIHPWMRSYVSVIDHPFFAVTGADGSFELKGLPPGEYTIEAVHERLDNQEMTVTVGEGGSETIEFKFSNN